jgi:hypothetical protein
MPVSVCESGERGYDTRSLRPKAAEPAWLTMPADTQTGARTRNGCGSGQVKAMRLPEILWRDTGLKPVRRGGIMPGRDLPKSSHCAV